MVENTGEIQKENNTTNTMLVTKHSEGSDRL
jgi:hypothetical protein